jgi:hypothetical protein
VDQYHSSPIYFWTALLMFMAALGAFIIGLRSGYKTKQLRFIPYYSLASCVQTLIGGYFIFTKFVQIRETRIVINTSVNIFVVIEFVFSYIFLLQVISSGKKRAILRILGSAFLLFLLGLWSFQFEVFYYYVSDFILVLESLLLVIPCLVYFYELFKFPRPIDLIHDPFFWAVTGILFYHSCIIPLYLLAVPISKMTENYAMIFSLNNVLYTILFLSFICASTCRIRTKES